MKILWLKSAALQREMIIDDLADKNPQAADAVETRIFAAIDHLPNFPEAGRPGRVNDTREIVLVNYDFVVVYRVKKQQIQILSVLHTSRQYPNANDIYLPRS